MTKDKNSQLRKTLRFSFLDGTFASVMIGLTQDFFAPFLILLGATVKHIGLLSALPNFFSSIIQLKSAEFVEKLGSRKKVINFFVFLQAFTLLPMSFMALKNISQPGLFIFLVILFTSFGAFIAPAWGSLMSDLIAENKRGSYFGWRNKILGFIIVLISFLAGYVLDLMHGINAFYGFAIIFTLAFIARIISFYFLTKMHEPPLVYNEEAHFTLINFLARIKESNFAKFVLFVSLMNFSVNIAAPFFSILMLRELKFSYLLYTTITLTATLTIYFMINRWGNHADKVGNLKIIKFVSPFIGIIPIVWVFNQKPGFLIIAQIFSGFLWAGFNLCASNFIYDAVTPPKRTRCIAYFNILNGTALCLGSLIGVVLLQKIPAFMGQKIYTLFIISGILRFIVGITMPRMLKEVRPVEKIDNNKLFFSMIGIKPFFGVDRKAIRFYDDAGS